MQRPPRPTLESMDKSEPEERSAAGLLGCTSVSHTLPAKTPP